MKPARDASQLPPRADRTAARAKWTFIGFLALAAFLLETEHRAHLLGVLPWLILLACPLMHLFMHRGHGGRGPADPHAARRPGEES